MGDGSFTALPMILQAGAAGNGMLAEGAAAAAPTDLCTQSVAASNGSASNQRVSYSNGHSTQLSNGALQDGYYTQAMQALPQQQWPAGMQLDATTAAMYLKQQQQLQQQMLMRQQQENLQQQPTVQVQLDTQMAQLHAQHNYSSRQAAGSDQPCNGNLSFPQMPKAQQGHTAQRQSFDQDQQQQQQQQQQLLLQQQYLAQQQQQQAVPPVSALRQSLFALQQQQQQHGQQQQPQAFAHLTQPQQQHQAQPMQPMHPGNGFGTPGSAAGPSTSLSSTQQPAGAQHGTAQHGTAQHGTVRVTGFQPATRSTDGPVVQLPQQQQQQQAHHPEQQQPVSAKGPPSSNLTIRLTVQLCSTYEKCSSALGPPQGGVPQPLPRRILTRPAAGVKNSGWDNESCDLILATQDVLVNTTGQRYIVVDMLGAGTFGQVVSSYSEAESKQVAVKVIKNQNAYYQQARVEVGILQLLNGRLDPHNAHHIVRLYDAFVHKGHLCLAFEQLGINLFELLKRNGFRGLSLGLLRLFLEQILDALIVLTDASIIHCDLKPENILLASTGQGGGSLGQLKLIDFGSACFEGRTFFSYIQSRFYRSPEVLLGLSYNGAIDMWSFGCVAAELFLGLPLFPGASEHDLMSRIIETLGPPPEWMMAAAKRTDNFFKRVPVSSNKASSSSSTAAPAAGIGSAAAVGGPGPGQEQQAFEYVLFTKEEFEAANKCSAPAGKRYFQHSRLADIIGHCPTKQGASEQEEAQERQQREALLDLLIGVLDPDPKTRWTPRQAIKHPFVTGESFTGPYQPAADNTPTNYYHQQQHKYRQQQQTTGLSPQQHQHVAAVAAAAAAAAAADAAAAAVVGSYGGTGGSGPLMGTSLGDSGAAVAAAAAAAAAAVGHYSQQQQQQQQGVPVPVAQRTDPVAMAARSAAHSHHQHAAASAAAAAAAAAAASLGMLQPTPPSSALGLGFMGPAGGSYAGPNGGPHFVPGSTGRLLQQASPTAAELHARAHAAAMAAIQQLSPQLGSSLGPGSHMGPLLGSSVSGGGRGTGGGSGSFNASLGLHLLQQHRQQQQQQQQQQILSSSYSPARPLLPSGQRHQQSSSSFGGSGNSIDSLHQQQQQQRQQSPMVASPAHHHLQQQQQQQQAAMMAAAAAAAANVRSSMAMGGGVLNTGAVDQQEQYAGLSTSLAHSFNHNLLMSPVSPAHIHMVAAMAAARQQQQQQQQQAAAAAAAAAPAPSGLPTGRGAALQRRWRTAMDQQQHQHQHKPASNPGRRRSSNGAPWPQQQQQQQMPLPASWQQQQASGMLGQPATAGAAVPAAGAAGAGVYTDAGPAFNWQQLQAPRNTHQAALAAAAAELAAKAAATAAPAGGAGTYKGQPGSDGFGRNTATFGGNATAAAAAEDAAVLQANSGSLGPVSRDSLHPVRSGSMRVSSTDGVMFAMEEQPEEATPPAAAAAAAAAAAVVHPSAAAAAAAGLARAIPASGHHHPGQQQQQHALQLVEAGSSQVEEDTEQQEGEEMSEHPGDWNPLYTDDQLLDEQTSPRSNAAAAAVTGPGLGYSCTGVPFGPPAAASGGGFASPLGSVVPAAAAAGARSRRGSLLQVRAMSVEPPGWNDDLAGVQPGMASSGGGIMLQMLSDRPHVAAPDPISGSGAGEVLEEELGAALDPNWSYQAPSHLQQGILQLRHQQLLQQQQQQQGQQWNLPQQQQQGMQWAQQQGSRSFASDSGIGLQQPGSAAATAAITRASADGWQGLPAMQQQQQQQGAGRRVSMMLVDVDEEQQ